jgi:hypothetical protein
MFSVWCGTKAGGSEYEKKTDPGVTGKKLIKSNKQRFYQLFTRDTWVGFLFIFGTASFRTGVLIPHTPCLRSKITVMTSATQER